MRDQRGRTPNRERPRRTYSFTARPETMAAADGLIDGIRFGSRSQVIEEALRLFVALQRQRQSGRDVDHVV